MDEDISPMQEQPPPRLLTTPSASKNHEPQPASDTASSLNPSSVSAQAVAGAESGPEILRRLSLASQPLSAGFNMDVQAQYPNLKLTGNVISATICIPYELLHSPGGDWEVKPRRGTSALFDSFKHLASDDTPWNHTLIGWTGEIFPGQNTALGETLPEVRTPSITNNERNSVQHHPTRPQSPLPRSGAHEAALGLAPPYNPVSDTLVITKEERTKLETQLNTNTDGKVIPVWLGEIGEDGDTNFYLKDQSRWRRYAEHEIYTLFHYRQHAPDNGRAEQKSWTDYVKLNQAFADRILNIYKPGDIIWVHDYHLMLLPSILRQRIENAYIGFFLHIPFPSSEYMRCLPKRTEILAGALGASMIGFQSYNFARHFNSCCKRILGLQSVGSAGVDAYGAHISVDVFPIGIDADAVEKAAFEDPVIDENIAQLRKHYGDRKIIIGRDRLDTVRGVAQKLMAYELFLDRYTEWRDNVILVQVTSPTSVEGEKDDPAHKIESKISALVSKINGKFGGLHQLPVEHYEQYLSSNEYWALLRAADVALITSVRDGMNTTSLEYVLCQRDGHGPLILSEFSGTAACLSNALHINPWDLGGVAKMLKEALEMPADQKQASHKKLYDHVSTHTVTYWANQFLMRLLTNLTSFSQMDLTPLLDNELLKAQYHSATKRIFMFDYDGTLTPIVKDPNAAIPTDKVFRTLKALAQDPKNEVWIISGRDAEFLKTWLGTIPELGLSAEHGCFMRPPNSENWENLTETMDMSWQEEVFQIFSRYTERTQGAWIEKKRVALTWHYRQADPDWGSFQAQECRKEMEATVGKKYDIEVMSGKANLEVRPTFVNKGSIATRLAHERGYGTDSPPNFILCLGDDQTDEDMFASLNKLSLPKNHVFTCTVGASSKRTVAKWHLLAPDAVLKVIGELPKPYTARKETNPNTQPAPETIETRPGRRNTNIEPKVADEIKKVTEDAHSSSTPPDKAQDNDTKGKDKKSEETTSVGKERDGFAIEHPIRE